MAALLIRMLDKLVEAGANVLVAGNFVFKAENPTQTIADLKKINEFLENVKKNAILEILNGI